METMAGQVHNHTQLQLLQLIGGEIIKMHALLIQTAIKDHEIQCKNALDLHGMQLRMEATMELVSLATKRKKTLAVRELELHHSLQSTRITKTPNLATSISSGVHQMRVNVQLLRIDFRTNS